MKIHFSLLGDTSFDEQEDVLVEEINSTGTISQLIVYNDDFNTF